jgi:uncharacterized membrane protein
MTGSNRKNYNRMIIAIAALLIILCLVFIAMLLEAANSQSFLVVFVLAFVFAIVVIFFTAKDMLK